MQINLKLDCTLYSGLGVHFHRNTQSDLSLKNDQEIRI